MESLVIAALDGVMARHRYEGDAVGNPLEEQRLYETVAYRYDDLDQLVEACYVVTGTAGACAEWGLGTWYAYDGVRYC